MESSLKTAVWTVVAAAALWILIPPVPWGCSVFPVLLVSSVVAYAFRQVSLRVRRVLAILTLMFFPLQCSKGLWEYHRASRPFHKLGGSVQASGDGMSAVAGAAGVNDVSLADTGVTDADLQSLRAHLSRLTGIGFLALSNTGITDAGLQYLTGLRNTTYVLLNGTLVTVGGWRQLKQALPHTQLLADDTWDEAALSPDRQRVALATCGFTRYPMTPSGWLSVSEAETSVRERRIELSEELVTSLAFSPDGERIAAGNYEGIVTIHDLQATEEAVRLEGHGGIALRLAFSPDGQRLACGYGDWDGSQWKYTSGAVKVWNARTGEKLYSIERFTDRVNSVAFSPDGRSLATASSDHSVQLWDATTGEHVRSFVGHEAPVYALAFSPDGGRLVSGDGNKRIKVWSTATGEELLELVNNGEISSALAFSEDGTLIAGGSYRPYQPDSWGRGTVTVWAAETGETVRILRLNTTNRVTALAFGLDVQSITAVEWGGLVTWDIQTGKQLRTVYKGLE